MSIIKTRAQTTINKPVSYSGVGIHTGTDVQLRFVPAKAGEGIYFKRVDLPAQPVIPARVEYVFDTQRSTNLSLGEIKLYTVEHVLAAVHAFQIDNLCIELSSIEPPAGNGGSDVFVELLDQAGLVELEAIVVVRTLKEPIYLTHSGVNLVALPSDTFSISYTLDYPQVPALGTQFYSCVVDKETFCREVAPCRTFALYEELSYLMDRGLIKGGSLENAVVVMKEAVVSKGGLFFKNEMARHKVLDIIGDLSLIGFPFTAHVISIRSGHATNVAFAKLLYSCFAQEGLGG